jgi:outer membrane immunogenic protein
VKRSVLVVAVLAFSTLTAAAADLPVKAPAYKAAPVAPGYDWTGFYVGGHVGGGWNSGNLRADYLPFPDFNVFPTLANSSATGVLGGVQAGYNWQFASRWVLGVEGDFSGTRMNSSLTVVPQQITPPVPTPSQPTTWSRNLNWLATARARLGYTVAPSVLLYATGGAAWGGFNYNASFVNTAPGSNNWANPFSATSSGYVVGGGGEWMLTNNWTVRAEYLYYRLSGKSNLATNPVFPTFPILFSWNATDTHTVRVGVNYKFGGPVVARY